MYKEELTLFIAQKYMKIRSIGEFEVEMRLKILKCQISLCKLYRNTTCNYLLPKRDKTLAELQLRSLNIFIFFCCCNFSLCIRKNKENSIVSHFHYVTKIIVINSSLCIIMEALGICVYNIQTKQVMKFKVDVEEGIERYIFVILTEYLAKVITYLYNNVAL